jgi:hypothetical protein
MAIRRDLWGSSVVIHRKSGKGSSNATSATFSSLVSDGAYELKLGDDSVGVSGKASTGWILEGARREELKYDLDIVERVISG